MTTSTSHSLSAATVRLVRGVQRFGADGQTLRKNMVLHGDEDADPFLFLAEDWFSRASGGFPDHPHRGFETVTLVLDGELTHRDNKGHEGRLGPDDVQWMTAGRGIVHSELVENDGVVHSLQLWLNLPARLKMTAPRYMDLRGAEAPVRREGGAVVTVYAGRSGDVEAHAPTHVPSTMLRARLAPGSDIQHTLKAGDNAFFYVLDGSGRVGDTGISSGQVAFLGVDDHDSDVHLRAGERGLDLVLYSAAPIGEPVVQYGPFVMNTPQEIEQAFRDFRAGRF